MSKIDTIVDLMLEDLDNTSDEELLMEEVLEQSRKWRKARSKDPIDWRELGEAEAALSAAIAAYEEWIRET